MGLFFIFTLAGLCSGALVEMSREKHPPPH